MEFVSKFGWLFALGLNLVLAWVAWSARNAFVPADKFHKELTARDDARAELEKRLIRAEAELEDKPTANALHELAVSITGIGGDLKALVARTDGLEGLVRRLETVADRQEQYLLNNKGGK